MTSQADLIRLVYELLDAHDDTLQLADDLRVHPRWEAHLGKLRDLQRIGREALALATPALGRLGPHSFLYEACDIPPGMTMSEFRAARSRSHRREGARGLVRWVRSHLTAGSPAGSRGGVT